MSDIELFSTGSGPDWRLSLRHDRGQIDLTLDEALRLAGSLNNEVVDQILSRVRSVSEGEEE